MSVGYNGRDLW